MARRYLHSSDLSSDSSDLFRGGRRPVCLCLESVCKSYFGVVAVEGVDLTVHEGEVHVVAGENGAGKSTLMRLIAQSIHADSGTIEIRGEPVQDPSPRAARRSGVAMVHQEFALAPHLTVAENLTLGQEPGRFGWIDRAAQRRMAREKLAKVGLDIDPSTPLRRLSVAQLQLVEIAKALDDGIHLLILDEPTATLSEPEIARLFEVIRSLTSQGIAILYISHRLDEIFKIGDRITVMRSGKTVGTYGVDEIDEPTLVKLMVGRDVSGQEYASAAERGDVALKVTGLAARSRLKAGSLEVRYGEIVGLAGLVGAGRTELCRAIFGADPATSGEIEIDGRSVRIRSPRQAIQLGIGYLTEDRKGDGLALGLSVQENVTMGSPPALAGGVLDFRREREVVSALCRRLEIKTPSLRSRVRALSGGNQQKVMLARWLRADAKVLLLDEPARGVDVGTKAQIFSQIVELAEAGKAIVVVSSYLPELLTLCDRIYVMAEGRTVGEVTREEFSEERIIAMAAGAEVTA